MPKFLLFLPTTCLGREEEIAEVPPALIQSNSGGHLWRALNFLRFCPPLQFLHDIRKPVEESSCLEPLPIVEGRPASVHLARFPKPEEIFSEDPGPLLSEWKTILQTRDVSLALLEEERKAKRIGKALEAELEIEAWDENLVELSKLSAADLKELFNVSKVTLVDVTGSTTSNRGANTRSFVSVKDGILNVGSAQIRVLPASGSKCARCWNFMPEVSDYGIWQNVCSRCQAALKEMGIEPPQADSTNAEASS